MSQPPSLAPDTRPPQPRKLEARGDSSIRDAPEQGAAMSELAVVSLPDLLQWLRSTDSGLRASDAAAILKRVGPNRIETVSRKSLAADFIGRFGNPLVLILLFAAAVSGFTGDIPSFGIIATIVLMSVILDVTSYNPTGYPISGFPTAVSRFKRHQLE